MNSREEIDNYLNLWDQAREKMPKPEQPQQSASFFGMYNHDEDAEEQEPDLEEAEHWRDVYYRAMEIEGNEEQLMIEAEEEKAKKKAKKAKKAEPKKAPKNKDDVRKPKDGDETPDTDDEEDGFGKDLANGPGKGVKFSANPIHFASKGADNKLRVTPNWTDGDELRELARLKSLMYDLESELLGTDVRGGDAEPIRVRLVKIQKQCEAMSQRLIPDPQTDVS
jgi:hypothetical protein